jgi:HEAT repeat protein
MPYARVLAAVLVLAPVGCGSRPGAGKAAPAPAATEPVAVVAPTLPAAGDDEPRFDGVPLSALLTMLDDANPEAATHAASALVPIGSPAIPALEKRLRSGSPLPMSQAISVLRAMAMGYQGNIWGTAMSIPPNPEAVQAFARCTKDPSPLVRAMALHTIAKLGPKGKDALPAVREAANDRFPAVRKAAEDALAAISSAGR